MPTISAYVSIKTYDDAKNLAEQNHTSVSKIIKSAFDQVEIKDKSLQLKILNELSAIGNNLNQISKHCNINKKVDILTLHSLVELQKKVDGYIDVM